MRIPSYLLLFVCAAATAGEQPAIITAADTPFPAQELVNVRASSEVVSARWTRRPDSYTLQLLRVAGIGETITYLRNVDPTFGSRTLEKMDGQSQIASTSEARASRTKAWLLRADGTQIMPLTSRSTPPFPAECIGATRKPDQGDTPPVASLDRFDRGCFQVETLYSFPLEGGEHAVALAIRIDENYFMEKLQPQVGAQ